MRNNELEHTHKLTLQRNNFCNKECKSKAAYYTPRNYCGLHKKIEFKNREKWEQENKYMSKRCFPGTNGAYILESRGKVS